MLQPHIKTISLSQKWHGMVLIIPAVIYCKNVVALSLLEGNVHTPRICALNWNTDAGQAIFRVIIFFVNPMFHVGHHRSGAMRMHSTPPPGTWRVNKYVMLFFSSVQRHLIIYLEHARLSEKSAVFQIITNRVCLLHLYNFRQHSLTLWWKFPASTGFTFLSAWPPSASVTWLGGRIRKVSAAKWE